ncbi:MAG: hypothetical protein HOF01_08935 [Chloroflexi bacterium]|nr:hypothetical protein [Chloroflexota bacterium]
MQSNVSRLAVVVALLAIIFVAVFFVVESDARIIAFTFVFPTILAINFWGFKRAIPVLVLIPLLNESATLAHNWYEGEKIFSDPDLRIHLVAAFAIIAVGSSYARVLKTTRILKGELEFRKVVEKRESQRAARQTILAELSREIGSIEDSARMKDQIVSFMHRVGEPDNVTMYERIDRLDAWIEVVSSLPVGENIGDSLRPSIAFGSIPKIESTTSFAWVPLQETNQTKNLKPERTLILPIRWQEKTIAFAALSYETAPEPDQQQIELLQEVALQISGSFAGSRVYLDVVNIAYRLEREATYRDRMIGVVSHEMNTPLTAAVALNDVLLRDRSKNLSDRQIEHLKVIRRNLQRIISVSQDMNISARIRHDALDLNKRTVNLATLLHETVDSFQPVIEGLGQKVQIEQIEEAVYVAVDTDRFAQGITNILSNASKFSRSGQTISVRMTSGRNGARIELVDNGSGVAAEDLENVFDWAVESGRERSVGKQGAGIGLFVAKAIIDAHDGTIGIESIPNIETKVWIEIPTTSEPIISG